ncbi:MAG TPA: hypothetical protein VMU25_03870 [Candidatus Paceibacterota bacterium]|nr:hypothetical protein [Candidatus Paceibacterota bacterium]
MGRTLKLVVWLVVLVLVLIGAVAYVADYYFQNLQSQQVQSTPTYLLSLIKAKDSGNNTEALAQYQTIESDASKSAEDEALAAINISGVAFSQSGNINDVLQEIQTMKAIVLNPAVAAPERATAMSILANEYNISGNNPTVFAEVYKDAPFNTYLVPGDPALSALNMQKASYDIRHTSTAAIYVAYLAAGQYFVKNLDASTSAMYISLATDYLSKADITALAESKASAFYPQSTKYVIYRAVRAQTIGRLALQKVQPFTTNYRTEFDQFFTITQALHSTAAMDATLSVRFQYAKVLAADSDAADAKTQLDQLAQELGALTSPSGYSFVASLKTEHANPTGPTWQSVLKMEKISPAFKAAVDSLVTSSSSSK